MKCQFQGDKFHVSKREKYIIKSKNPPKKLKILTVKHLKRKTHKSRQKSKIKVRKYRKNVKTNIV